MSRTMVVHVEGIEPAGDGAAYARVGGRRLPIDFAIPGERVEVRLTEGREAAQVVSIPEPSPHRVTPRCPYFGPCGGCMWQHIAYDEQLRLKRGILEALLRHVLGSRAPRVKPMLAGTEVPWGFRSKVHFVFAPQSRAGGLVMGHYRRHSMTVVPVTQCPVHAAEGNRVAFAIRDALESSHVDAFAPRSSTRDNGVARHVVVRATLTPPETVATLVVTRNDKSLRPAVRRIVASEAAPSGLHLNVHDRPGPYLFGRDTRRLHGRERARETVAGVSFLVSPTAFFQTNVAAARRMVEVVLEHVRDAGVVLDLYAGAGLFSLPLARRGARVVAVEENGQAVEDGEASRAFNGIAESQCRFVRARVEALVRDARRRTIPAAPDLVILDPPRPGCPREVLDWICRTLRPPRLAYISCNPEALATDLPVALDAGYHVTLVQPIDMFPHTPHIETVVGLAADR